MRSILAVAVLFVSSLCFAQTPTPAPAAAPTPAVAPAPTADQLKAQIQTLQAMSQVYFERLKSLTEFQQYMQTRQQIEETQNQLQQTMFAQQKQSNAAAVEASKAEMQKRILAEKAKDAAPKK
jgi:hypothetical protein